MIIKNFRELATTPQKKLALSLIESGLKAAMQNTTLQKIVKKDYLLVEERRIPLRKYHRIHVVAIGKAADLMTRTVSSLTKIHGGIVVIPKTTHSLVKSSKFTILRGSHPIPGADSVRAAEKTLEFLAKLQKTDFVIFLISGGTSSLLSLPNGISLREKQVVTDLLLRSGAYIQEINCVRKHLSKVKGGQLIESLRCEGIAFTMSDVIDDDLSTIASGITYYDDTTFQDAKRILIKYGLKNKAPKNVWNRIDLGSKRLIPETPKRPKIKNCVVSSNKICLMQMAKDARKLGFVTKVVPSVSGNVEKAASKISRLYSKKPKSCLIFGGETTVTVKGKGKGGRNQELVLYLLKRSAKQKTNFVMTSLGTDGIDGNTSVAGAIAASNMSSKKITKYLHNNDSNSYFKKYGGLIFTGPTHINLMDIGLMLGE